MKLVRISEAQPGMILAQPVLDQRGSVILGADTELTDDLIGRLAARSVAGVYVEESEDAKTLDPEAVKKDLDRTFSDVKGDPIMDALRDAVENHKLGDA